MYNTYCVNINICSRLFRMAEFLMWDILHMDNRVKQLERRQERRDLRDTKDPFELHDDVFVDLFRLPPDTVLELADALRPRLRRLRPYGISPERQVRLNDFVRLL